MDYEKLSLEERANLLTLALKKEPKQSKPKSLETMSMDERAVYLQKCIRDAAQQQK